jgi:hypothetical protein
VLINKYGKLVILPFSGFGETMSFTMQMPNVCAKCAENPPTQAYTIQRQQISISPWTLLTMFFGVRVMNRKTTFYQFPICSDCDDNIASKKRYWGRVAIIGMILFTAAILLLYSETKALNSVAILATLSERLNSNPLSFTAIVLIIMGMMIMITAANRGAARVVSVSRDGKRFSFYNKEFQKAFKEINPTS